MSTRPVVDPHNAKSAEYKQVINQIQGEGKCPFCPENFKYHKEPILKEQGDWLITRNSWPYGDTEHHFIAICRTHKEQFSELTPQDFTDLSTLINWVTDEFDIPGGGFAMRFGDTRYTGATVVHLHAHLIVPQIDPETGRAKPVRFPIG
jgi:diadenosine tetraphosphate (Ap4A) HIT family hydrolase